MTLDLQKVNGDSRFTKSCIHKWFHRFSDGRKSVKDDPRSGRKVTVSTDKRIAAIEEYIMKDRRITVWQVGENFGIGYGTAQDILTNVLGMRRVCARWVPRLLVPEQKTVRVQIFIELQQRLSDERDSFLNKVITCDETWFHFFEPESKQQSIMWKHTWSASPVKACLSKSVGKVMSIIFCDTKGIVLNHIVPDKTIVNGDYYSGVPREQLRRAIQDKHPELYRSGFILHQDSAPVHVSRVVKQTMSDLDIEPLQHPPYSQDLAICDFFLFPTVKRSPSWKEIRVQRGTRYCNNGGASNGDT